MGKFYKTYASIKNTIVGIPNCFKIAAAKTYYPEKKRKNYLSRLFNNFGWLIKNHENCFIVN